MVVAVAFRCIGASLSGNGVECDTGDRAGSGVGGGDVFVTRSRLDRSLVWRSADLRKLFTLYITVENYQQRPNPELAVYQAYVCHEIFRANRKTCSAVDVPCTEAVSNNHPRFAAPAASEQKYTVEADGFLPLDCISAVAGGAASRHSDFRAICTTDQLG